MFSGSLIVLYIFIFASAFMLMQLVIGAGRQGARKLKRANVRIKVLARGEKNGENPADALQALRRSRGLEDQTKALKLLKWLNTLVIHSGLRIGPHGVYGVYVIMYVLAFACATLVFWFTRNLLFAALGFIVGFALPVGMIM